MIDLSCSLADPDMTDGSLQSRVADLPRNTILLLEDIDAAFNSRFAFFTLFSSQFSWGRFRIAKLYNARGPPPPFADQIRKVLFDSSSTIKNKEARKQVFGSVSYSLSHHLQTNFANPDLLRLCFTSFCKKYFRGKIVGSRVLTLGQLWARSVLKHIAPKQATLLLHFKY